MDWWIGGLSLRSEYTLRGLLGSQWGYSTACGAYGVDQQNLVTKRIVYGGGEEQGLSRSSRIEIRCPIYGFIPVSAWEREIIGHPPFQRLRRIRQLAWTDHVYPGAMHTRFEHSLGVMHMATMLYDGIVARSRDELRKMFNYNDAGLERYRQVVRLAALLHDVGHGPFSHAVEDLAPEKTGEGRTWRHEEYSTAIVRQHFKDLIENHPENGNYNIQVDEVAGLIDGTSTDGRALFWQDLIAGQLDADRMDYLLRDPYHAGVEYGRFDWQRIAATVALVREPESETPRLGVLESGRHAAESMLIARYMMFTQVYFHKTRVILDFHLHQAIREMLPGELFPDPERRLAEYLTWDDWRVLGRLTAGEGGAHGQALLQRDFHRMVWETPEFPSQSETQRLDAVEREVEDLMPVRREANKSWYKVGPSDLLVAPEVAGNQVQPLSQCSTIMKNMQPTRRIRLYVPPDLREKADERIHKLKGTGE